MLLPLELIDIIFQYADYGRKIIYNTRTKKHNIVVDENHSKFKYICRIYDTFQVSKIIDAPDHEQYQITYEIKKRYVSTPILLKNITSYKSFMTIVIDKQNNKTDLNNSIQTIIELDNSSMIISR